MLTARTRTRPPLRAVVAVVAVAIVVVVLPSVWYLEVVATYTRQVPSRLAS